jgi:hypothetical protein
LAITPGVEVNVEKKGTYICWMGYKDGLGNDRITQPQRFKGKSADVDVSVLPLKSPKAKIYVMDKRTGNMAIVDYTPPKDPKAAKPIGIKKDDLQYVRSVSLRAVAEDGAPVESGLMIITDGNGDEFQSIFTPADEGVALFENVAAGEISVQVKAGGLKKTIDSDIELPADRKTPGFARDIKVAGDVHTLPRVATKSKAKSHEEAKPQGGVGTILQYLSGLIFLAVVIAIVVIVLKARGVTAKAALEKMGVELPQGGEGIPAGEAAPAIDPSACQFCGQKRDASGHCACTLTPAGAPMAAPTGVPRLVGSQGTYAGHIFEITGASAVIGREVGNDVALPNDTTSSRRHATITVSGGEYSIRDEGSSNGTFVNGAKITEQKLRPGDELQIGGSKFRFES